METNSLSVKSWLFFAETEEEKIRWTVCRTFKFIPLSWGEKLQRLYFKQTENHAMT